MKKNDRGKGRKHKVLYSGKNLPQWIFTELLVCIKNDMYPLQIANYLSKKYGRKYTKQHINYYLKILLRRKFVKKIKHKNRYIGYQLTPSGKNALGVGRKDYNYDLHNIVMSIPLIDVGKLPEGQINMSNWKFAKLDFGSFKVFVNYGKISKLMIFPPKIYGNTVEEVLVKCGSHVRYIVAKIEDSYKCKADLDLMAITRKPHLHPLNDPVINQIDRERIQYSGKNIEFNRSGDAHADILGFEGMRKYDRMLDELPIIKETMGSLAKTSTQIFNLQAIMGETLRQMKDAIISILKRGGSLDTQTLKERLETPLNEAESTKTGLDSFFKQRGKDELVRIETLEVIPSFVADRKGILTEYPELNKKAKVYLPESVAMALIRKGRARKI